MESYGYIYKTTNANNGMLYIGKSKGKFNQDYHGSGIYLKHAILKHGKHNFSTELICHAKTKKELNEMERHCIDSYRKQYGNKKLYNISDGGDGGATMTGKKHTIETRKKMSRNHSGGTPQGYCMPEEQKRKISLASQGKPGTFKGRKHSKSTRKKMSLTAQRKDVKQKKCTKERNKKISDARTGKSSGMLGKVAHNKGKTNIEYYGEEKAKEISDKISNAKLANCMGGV